MLDVAAIKDIKGKDYQVGRKDLVEAYGEKINENIAYWTERKAGRIAYNSALVEVGTSSCKPLI